MNGVFFRPLSNVLRDCLRHKVHKTFVEIPTTNLSPVVQREAPSGLAREADSQARQAWPRMTENLSRFQVRRTSRELR